MHSIAPADTQLRLFEHNRIISCSSTASARTRYGEAAQEIVCTALELLPIKINGNFSTCFDAFKDGIYYEIKSVKNNGKLVIYDWRIKKEQDSTVTLHYAILMHNIKEVRSDIISAMCSSKLSILLVESAIIHKLALSCPLIRHKTYKSKRNGYSRAGYKDGYRNLSVKSLFPYLTQTRFIDNPFGANKIQIRSQF